jgi:hypothetical protein
MSVNSRAGDPIPMKVLVCDANDGAAESLRRGLEGFAGVLPPVARVDSVSEARSEVRSGDYNVIFIDPLSLGLEAASSFVFEIRNALPEIVFALYVDKAAAERDRAAFYGGDRARFSHYYTLDKQVPVGAFTEELEAVVRLCQADLSWRMSSASLERLRTEAAKLAGEASGESLALLDAVGDNLARLASPSTESNPKTVFLSYRFAEEEYVEGLTKLLVAGGFEVLTGKSSNTYVSRVIIERIRQAPLFLSLMTRADEKADGTFTTSAWLLEEKGVALAFGKPLVLMIEEGVVDFGGLQGDWQRIHFGAKGFLNAALEAVEQLRYYVGGVDRLDPPVLVPNLVPTHVT